jgi:hypothetical protein
MRKMGSRTRYKSPETNVKFAEIKRRVHRGQTMAFACAAVGMSYGWFLHLRKEEARMHKYADAESHQQDLTDPLSPQTIKENEGET